MQTQVPVAQIVRIQKLTKNFGSRTWCVQRGSGGCQSCGRKTGCDNTENVKVCPSGGEQDVPDARMQQVDGQFVHHFVIAMQKTQIERDTDRKNKWER